MMVYYLYFFKAKKTGDMKKIKTDSYLVLRSNMNKYCDDRLGKIIWHGGWWQYIFKPESNTFWSKECLDQVSDFIEKINKKQREQWKRNKVK